MKTITAHIPARKSYKAYDVEFTLGDDGKWTGGLFGGLVHEADVLDTCKMASNWPAIRAEHFPLAGFAA